MHDPTTASAQRIRTASGPFAMPGRREGLWLGVVLSLLACLPYLVAVRPQLTDYPAHLARYFIMLEGGRDPILARYYALDWRLTANLGVDLLIQPLARIFGIERAGWLVGAVIPPLTGLGLVCVEWTLRRRVGVGAMLALALVWSPAMGMGFYNFCLSLALALFAFALWVRMEGARARAPLFLLLSPVLWLCHLSGWGVLGLLVFGYEWSRRKNWSAFLAPWPLAPPFLGFLLPGGASVINAYGDAVWTYKWHIWLQALRAQSEALDLLSLLFLLVVLLVALRKRLIDGRLGWAALLLLIGSIAVPRHLGGGDYADFRLIAAGLMIACLAIDLPGPRWLLWAAPALFLVRLAVATLAWQASSTQTERILGALDHLPVGAKVAGAVVVERNHWALNPLEHVTSYATVRRDALVNSHFAIPGVHMLRLKEGGAGFVDPSHRILHRAGDPIDLAAFAPAREADWLWYIGDEEPATMPAGAQVVWRTQGSLLARLANSPGRR